MFFKNYSKEKSVSGVNQVKSSVARGIRCKFDDLPALPASGPLRRSDARVAPASICEQYPWLEKTGVIDVLLPKKEDIRVAKW